MSHRANAFGEHVTDGLWLEHIWLQRFRELRKGNLRSGGLTGKRPNGLQALASQ